MILIVSFEKDFTCDFVVDELNRQKIDYYRLNTDFPSYGDLSLRFDSENGLITSKTLSVVDSIYYRRTARPQFEAEDQGVRDFLEREYGRYIDNLMAVINGRWMSNPLAVDRAENKALQLSTAVQIGFRIPETILTGSHELIKEFVSKHDDCIIKPLYYNQYITESGSRNIYTNILSSSILDDLQDVSEFPSLVQRRVPKEHEIRVTVVGRTVFSASVDSQSTSETKVDWRRLRLPFEECSIPKDIENKCVQIVADLGLNFGAIDLILTPEGEYYFLEVNPNGQWAWIESDTGMPIAKAIADWLSNGDSIR